MYLEDYVRAKNPLAYWKELLQEWVFLVHRIFRISNKRTAVYAERERANTGLLAAAATRNGWVALEECRTEKRDKYVNQYTYSGRCDLVLWRDRRHHEIEAKLTRILVFGQGQPQQKIRQALDRAMDDAKRSTNDGYRSEKKIAVTYVVPVIDPDVLTESDSEEIAGWLEDIIKYIRKELKPTLLAYAFPGAVSLEGSDRLGLGVILIGQNIGSSN